MSDKNCTLSLLHPFLSELCCQSTPAPLSQASQFPERVTPSSAITVPLIRLRPTPSRLHRPLRPPGLLASKSHHGHSTVACVSLRRFCGVMVLMRSTTVYSLHLTQSLACIYFKNGVF